MELENCGDGDHSVEMESALKRFEDVCNSLENEHTKLLELEKRRKKLNEDLERLRNEINEEKDYFRSAIDEPFVEELVDIKHNNSIEQLNDLVEPMILDTGAIKEFIRDQREEIALRKQELDLQSSNENVEQYKVSYIEEENQEAIAELDTQCNSNELKMMEVSKDEDIEMLNSTEATGDNFVEYLTSDDD